MPTCTEGLKVGTCIHKLNSTLNLLILTSSSPVLPGTERRGVEEVRSGVPGPSQAGGAAVPDAESPRRGEARQVRGAAAGGREGNVALPARYFPNGVHVTDATCTSSRRANEEIAQVRAKANSDGTALTASLRKEQMKNDSLEQALQQKVPDRPAFILSLATPPPPHD